MFHIFVSIFIILFIAYLYKQFQHKEEQQIMHDYDKLIKQYLYNPSKGIKEDLKLPNPILWIHIPKNKNSRTWINWGSRNTYHNPPYTYLTLLSIIRHSKNNFRICFINDESFKHLLPLWKVNILKAPHSIRDRLRQLAILKIIYLYGGLHLPIHYLPLSDISKIYNYGLKEKECFFGKVGCHVVDNDDTQCSILTTFVGAKQHSDILKNIIQTFEYEFSSDFTDECVFKKTYDSVLRDYEGKGDIKLIEPSYLGCIDKDQNSVSIETLFENNSLTSLYDIDSLFGVYIPHECISKRTKYNWFEYIPYNQILHLNTILSRCFVLSLGNSLDI